MAPKASTILPILVIMDSSGNYKVNRSYQNITANQITSAKFKPNDESKIIAVLGNPF